MPQAKRFRKHLRFLFSEFLRAREYLNVLLATPACQSWVQTHSCEYKRPPLVTHTGTWFIYTSTFSTSEDPVKVFGVVGPCPLDLRSLESLRIPVSPRTSQKCIHLSSFSTSFLHWKILPFLDGSISDSPILQQDQSRDHKLVEDTRIMIRPFTVWWFHLPYHGPWDFALFISYTFVWQ